MAYKPSKRGSREFKPLEINIFPMMNLMVVLVPLLLSTATAIKIGVIELNLPPATAGTISQSAIPTEAREDLDLTISLTSEGIYLSSSKAVLSNTEEGIGATIPPNEDGTWDFEALSQLLLEIKRRIAGTAFDTKRIIIQAEPQIEYQPLVSAMDASRSISIDDQTEIELFPEVTISSGIVRR
jgi:biopolymer transport protein ExbD